MFRVDITSSIGFGDNGHTTSQTRATQRRKQTQVMVRCKWRFDNYIRWCEGAQKEASRGTVELFKDNTGTGGLHESVKEGLT